MATKQVIDLESLLAPIDGENPCGKDISPTGVIAELTELRRSEEAENLGEWAPKEVKTANWTKVLKISTDVFKNQSKDLRVAGFLVEAYISQEGLAGLRDGLQLIAQVHERYWDYLYPSIQPRVRQEDDEDYEDDSPINVRAAALGRLDMMLASAIPFAKVTKPLSDRPALTHADWKMANYYDNLQLGGEKEKKAYEEVVADGKPTGEIFRKGLISTGKAFYQNFQDDLESSISEVAQLNVMIEERYREAEELPIFSNLAKTLDEFRHMVSEIEKVVGVLREAEAPAEAGPGDVVDGVPARRREFTGEGVPLDPMDRGDAIRRLRAVANYFRTAEPHSPVTFLVERAVAWAAMPLDQWLAEVVKDDAVLSAIRETLGVKPAPPE